MRRLDERGQTIVEVLVAIGLTAVLLPGMLTAFVATRDGRASDTQRLAATALLREANEAVRAVKLRDWNNVASDGTFHPLISGGAWSLASGAETINSYNRQIGITAVRRNAAGAVVENGGEVDPATKKVVVTVSWNQPAGSAVSSTSYYSRYDGNESQTQSGQVKLSTGSFTNTVAASGQVELASPGAGTTYETAGTYESPSFDAGGDAAFNYFTFNVTMPAGTEIKFQLASNTDNATWNFVGPDGTAASFYTTNGPVPLPLVSGRYLRYKAMLSGDGTTTPALISTAVNYSL